MIVGIDPGFTGAWFALHPTGCGFEYDDLDVLGSGRDKHLNAMKLVDQMKTIRLIHNIELIVVEKVTSSPQMGVASSFRFGETFGAIRGVVAALEVRVEYVAPAIWKRALKVSADKDKARMRAQELMPACRAAWPLKKHDGRAEAALLAWYGREVVL